jgi:Flp pilus assembly protein TadG
VKRNRKQHAGERGAALLLVTVSMAAMLATVGLAIDAGQLYVTKQAAQAAADAAAQAGVMDMYNGTGGDNGLASAKAYAKLNGFDPAAYTVQVSWPDCSKLAWCKGHVKVDNSTPNLIQVTVSKPVTLTFLGVLNIVGLGLANPTVSATAYAAISYAPAAIPIVVTHPHLVDALQANGGTQITIAGGPTRSIQVDSDGTINSNGHSASTPEAVLIHNNAIVNLSQAGPNHTGADFRTRGPATFGSGTNTSYIGPTNNCPASLCLGTSGNYLQPASIITDPFWNLPQPTSSDLQPQTPIVTPNGNGKLPAPLSGMPGGCTAQCPAHTNCTVFKPGIYSGGIAVSGGLTYFWPGLYYISSADTGTGFNIGPGANAYMINAPKNTGDPTVCPATPDDSGTGSGMVVFNAGKGTFQIGSNGVASLYGPAITNPTYEGIIFWEDRTLNPDVVVTHTFGGGGQITITGTIYANMLSSNVTYNNYQEISLSGNSGSTTTLVGEIVTNVLFLTGGGKINMQLSTTDVRDVRAVAFVQ